MPIIAQARDDDVHGEESDNDLRERLEQHREGDGQTVLDVNLQKRCKRVCQPRSFVSPDCASYAMQLVHVDLVGKSGTQFTTVR